MRVKSDLEVEIELHLEGDYRPATPAILPGYASGGGPPQPEGVDDVVITDLRVITRHLNPVVAERGSHLTVEVATSIFDGVDTTNPEVQKLLDNLLRQVADAAQEALIAEVPEEE